MSHQCHASAKYSKSRTSRNDAHDHRPLPPPMMCLYGVRRDEKQALANSHADTLCEDKLPIFGGIGERQHEYTGVQEVSSRDKKKPDSGLGLPENEQNASRGVGVTEVSLIEKSSSG